MSADTTQVQGQDQAAGQAAGDAAAGAGINPEFLDALRNKLSSQDSEIQALRSQAKTIDQLKAAFSGGQKDEGPKGKWIDPILQHALDAEKRGQPMPITTEIAVAVQKLQDQLEEYEARNRKQEDALKRVTDPSAWQDQQMFASMDDQLQRLVNQLYPGENKAQYDAMVQRATKYLNELGEDPEVWREFRNNRTAQARLVQLVASQFVPKRALDQMRDEYERKSPYTKQQLEEAWEEAKQIPDERKRSEIMAKLRHTIIGLNLQKRMKSHR